MTKSFRYKTPKGYQRIRTYTGSIGVARVLLHLKTHKRLLEILLWSTKTNPLKTWESRIDFVAMKVNNIYEAAYQTVHPTTASRGGLILQLPKPTKSTPINHRTKKPC